MTDAEVQERAQVLYEKHGGECINIARMNTRHAGQSNDKDINELRLQADPAVFFEAALLAARAQERKRCDKLAERAYRHAIRRQEDECTAECECCDYAISLLDALWGDICNPPAERGKEKRNDKQNAGYKT